MNEPRLVVARGPFSKDINGATYTVMPGKPYWTTDPLYAELDPEARHRLWEELKVESSVPPPPPEPTVPSVAAVETATAGPGERRRVTRGARTETAS